MARPRLQIDTKLLEGLSEIGCTDTEIATLVGCSVDTINRRFAEILSKGRKTMRMKLRRAQIREAEKGNVTMLIWLGKQYLDQADKSEATITHKEFEVEIGGDGSIKEANPEAQYVN